MDNQPVETNPISDHLQNFIHQQAHHVAEETFNSPAVINRVIGEAMRHIGSNLAMTSSAYLPLQSSEVLVQPEVMEGQDTRALVMVQRTFHDKNSFQVLATATVVDTTKAESEREFHYKFTTFQPNPDALGATQFLNLPEALQKELLRQFAQLLRKEGSVLMQCVLINNYFTATPQQPAIPGATVAEPAL